MQKVYVSETKNTGRGLFANKDIKKNETIFIIKGTIKKETYDSRYKVGSNWIALKKRVWLSPFENNPSRFINHSCESNAGLKGKVTVVAIKPIKKDEEVTINYSTIEDDPYWNMKCNCGSKNCRKIIRSVRFLPSKLFKKYKNYIPLFLKRSYMQTNQK